MAEISQQEQQEVLDIVTGFYKQRVDSEEEVNKLLQNLGAMVQQQGAKLVHINQTVFMVLVQGEGVVDFYAMYDKFNKQEQIKNLKQFVAYAKNIGIKTLITQTLPEDEYEEVLDDSGYKFQVEGEEDVNVFTLKV
jgi:hypothetical protein